MHHEESSDSSDFLGARLGEERRLVLVPLDPNRPWTAFRRMRAWMKRSEANRPDAQIIPLRPTDADG
ncbi:MAG: hypothetical protein ACRDJ1_01905 [Actinomycetota bacterium]